jgi:hypothetical protein
LKRSSQEELTQGAPSGWLRRSKEERKPQTAMNVSKDGNIVSIVAGKPEDQCNERKKEEVNPDEENPDEKSNKVTNKVSTLTHGGSKQRSNHKD